MTVVHHLTTEVRMNNHRGDFCTVDEAIAELRAGRMIVLVDDENRENEGDLVIAVEKATPEAINFMMRNACGQLCLAMSPALCDKLHLEPMSRLADDPSMTPLTVKFDARTGITTIVTERLAAVLVTDRDCPGVGLEVSIVEADAAAVTAE